MKFPSRRSFFVQLPPLVITRFINCVPRKLFVSGVRWTSNVLDFSLDLTVRKKNLKCLRNQISFFFTFSTDVLCVCFACGLFIQELMELWQQGCLNYFSKWWNVIDLVMALAFLISYIVWGSAWLTYRGWRPESPSFIFSALIYASACGVAFFHLGRFFQVSSTLGPMQLCLFNMLKDVIKFLAIISVLFFAFVTGLTKIYSYYIQSEKELQKQNITIHYNTTHPYAK